MPTVRNAAIAAAILVIGIVALDSSPPRERAPSPKAAPVCAPTVIHGDGSDQPVSLTAGRGCLYDTGTYDQSPSIQITRQGVLFVGRNAAGVLRSTDGGHNWQALSVPALPNGDSHAKGVHGYVHVDPVTDRVYYLTGNSAQSCGAMQGGGVVSWTDDLGASWNGSTVGCGTYDWGRLVTGRAPAGSQQRAVYFFGVAPRLVGGLRPVYRSLDGGATWTQLKNPASVTTEAGAGVAAPDGTIYFDYPEFIGFDHHRIFDQTYPFKPANLCRAMIAVSEDLGEHWRQEAIPNSHACNSMTGQQRVAVDGAGTVYALWNDDRDSQVYLVVSRDKARSWSAPVRVLPPGATFNNGHANIVAGEPGHIVISSLNTSAQRNPRRWIVSGYGVWHAYLSESFDGDTQLPHFRSVDLDTAGDPTLAEGDSPSEAEAYLGISPSGQAWATFSRHGARLGVGSRITVARIEP
jgi:hypothetical protein